MFKSGMFTPSTEHELTVIMDVTWQAISEARRNMRLIEEECDRAKKSIETLKEELKRAQRKGKEAAGALHVLEKQSRESEEQRRALEENVKSAASQYAELRQARDAEKVGAEDQRKQLAAAGDALQALKQEFGNSDEQRRVLEAQLGKAGERQTALEAELSDARATSARLAEEQERLQRELTKAQEEIENWNAQLATEAELGAILQTDVDLLQHAMKRLDKLLDNQFTDPFLTPAHKDKRMIWIGCKDCPGCSLFTAYSMEKVVASDPEQALEILSGRGADGLITDISVTGIDWLSDVRKRWPDLIIIVTTSPADAHLAVDGKLCSVATTVFTQPFEHEDVAVAARCAFLHNVLSSGGEALDAERTPKRPRLLIADDDESTRALLSTGLNERGYDTACVENGAAALEAVGANDFDAFIVAIQTPGMNGIELTANAKKLKPRLPIIILSAVGGLDISLKSMRAGAYGYVRKPADMEELSFVIERAILRDRLERELRDQNVLLDKRTNELEKALSELQGLQEAVKLIAIRRQSQANPVEEPA